MRIILTITFFLSCYFAISACTNKSSSSKPDNYEDCKTSHEQKLATEFSCDIIRIIGQCKKADDLLSRAIFDLVEHRKSEIDCLAEMYKAKGKLNDISLLVEKWEKKGTIYQIKEEISELRRAVEAINKGCENWIITIEKIYSNEAVDVALQGTQATSKLLTGREKLFSFVGSWSLRIHHGENHPMSHHIQLSKEEYSKIKNQIDNSLSEELKEFSESKSKNDISWYVFCARLLDYAVSEELEKGIDEENIQLTRFIRLPDSTEVAQEGEQTWIHSKFQLPSGPLSLKTIFNKNNLHYEKQSLWINNSYFEEVSEPKIFISPEGKTIFAFSHFPYNTICCVLEFDKNLNKHQCKLLVSKFDE